MARATMGTLAVWMLTVSPVAGAAQMPGTGGSPAGQSPFWHGDGHMMGWHWGWWLVWVMIAVVVIWAVVRATTSGHGGPQGHPSEGSEEALRRRYASGEITREEFEERLEVLRKSR